MCSLFWNIESQQWNWPIWGQWLFDHLKDYCLRNSMDSGKKYKISEYTYTIYICILYIPICYMCVYFSSHFNLYFYHTSSVVDTFIGTLLVFTYSIFILTLCGCYYYYSTLIPFTKWRLWGRERLSNLIKYTQLTISRARIPTQAVGHVLNFYVLHCLKTYESW